MILLGCHLWFDLFVLCEIGSCNSVRSNLFLLACEPPGVRAFLERLCSFGHWDVFTSVLICKSHLWESSVLSDHLSFIAPDSIQESLLFLSESILLSDKLQAHRGPFVICAGLHSQGFLCPCFKTGHCSNPSYWILLRGVSIHLNISFVCMSVLSACTFVHCTHTVPAEDRRSHWGLWNWSYNGCELPHPRTSAGFSL